MVDENKKTLFNAENKNLGHENIINFSVLKTQQSQVPGVTFCTKNFLKTTSIVNFSSIEGLTQGENKVVKSHIIDYQGKNYYNFIGKILGKGLYDKNLLKVNINRIILKHLLQEKIVLEDIRYLDNQVRFYSNIFINFILFFYIIFEFL